MTYARASAADVSQQSVEEAVRYANAVIAEEREREAAVAVASAAAAAAGECGEKGQEESRVGMRAEGAVPEPAAVGSVGAVGAVGGSGGDVSVNYVRYLERQLMLVSSHAQCELTSGGVYCGSVCICMMIHTYIHTCRSSATPSGSV